MEQTTARDHIISRILRKLE